MKNLFVLVALIMLTGCTGVPKQPSLFDGQGGPTVIFHPSDADALLSCVSKSSGLKRKEYQGYLDTAKKEMKGGGDPEKLRYICLGLHKDAGQSQFSKSVALLRRYIEAHPDSRASLEGIELLAKRIDTEKSNRWAVRNKLLDARDSLEQENNQLRERLAEVKETTEECVKLQASAAQDQVRIKELQKQIEQLKNIENIIKNREL